MTTPQKLEGMASRVGLEPPGRPEPGQLLLVIHDFTARSSDELSLAKGDRVELLEADDDFGDGWYLGRHLTNGNTGLFPEVYTRPAPRGTTIYTNIGGAGVAPGGPPIKVQTLSSAPATETTTTPTDTRMSVPTPETEKKVDANRHASAISEPISSPVTSPLQAAALIMASSSATHSAKFFNPAVSILHSPQDSPVMNETLSVINEHITDMNTPRPTRERSLNDSSSEYSSHLDHRLSYIHGEETDEEEQEDVFEEEEVSKWTPNEVAAYLSSVGVEPKHCEVFREQDISGDVLLEMEQTSVFIKEFDLGSVGRRLKTWQKVKALQDQVRGATPPATRRATQSYGEEGSSDAGSRRSYSNSTSVKGAFGDRPGSRQTPRLSHKQSMRSESSPATPSTVMDSPLRTVVVDRPSAASIRELNHSRRNSSYDFSATKPPLTASSLAESMPAPDASHKKQPSFDRNWTMSTPRSPPPIPHQNASGYKRLSRPVSSTGLKEMLGSTFEALTSGSSPDVDRGYFSGDDTRKRNVLRKKCSMTHSRQSSYVEESRAKTASTNHPRFGSVDSSHNSGPLSASQRYYGMMMPGRKRAPSATSAELKPTTTSTDSSPIVTKLDDEISGPPRSRSAKASDWLLPGHSSTGKNRGIVLRAISDAITGHEKTRASMPIEPIISAKESPMASPSRTGSSTPSGGANSFELDSPNISKSPSNAPVWTPTQNKSSAVRKKTKKETSAYTRGLEKKTPQEQMIDCDYSGWMKKKNTNLMTTWKPRLFILKGKRLSYYYTENDEQEQGLIDISGYRVLPAESDRLTGLHATLTGATKSPTSPSDSQTMTMAASEAAAEVESSLSKGPADQMFIFKLVPPRAGQTRAVNFTKPTVHYFALPNIKQGRLWMAALMKATIDRDESAPFSTTYQQKTISLAKARAMRHRPPALMNLDEKVEEPLATPMGELRGLNINGIIFDHETKENDSGISGVNGACSTELQGLDSAKNLSLFSFETETVAALSEKDGDAAVV